MFYMQGLKCQFRHKYRGLNFTKILMETTTKYRFRWIFLKICKNKKFKK